MLHYGNIRLYYDTDSDSTNPGYVVVYCTYEDQKSLVAGHCEQHNLTAALDATTEDEALEEAAALLSVALDEIEVE